MKKFTITFKKSKHSKTITTWERFANSIIEARADAIKAIEYEYYGDGVLLSVRFANLADDPTPMGSFGFLA
jgi:hypothetical protein